MTANSARFSRTREPKFHALGVVVRCHDPLADLTTQHHKHKRVAVTGMGKDDTYAGTLLLPSDNSGPTCHGPVGFDEEPTLISTVCGLVWNLIDILPGDYYQIIRNSDPNFDEAHPMDNTYASGARRLKGLIAIAAN